MTSRRKQLIQIIDAGAIEKNNIPLALTTSKIIPDKISWLRFVDNALLWLGGLALAFSVLFFVAYNWSEMGHIAHFMLVEFFIVLTVLFYWMQNKHQQIAKLSLFITCILLGVLLALYGQTYQTGADTWQLFFNWALLILPWVIIGQFPAIWILWIALINLSLILYYQSIGAMLFVLVTEKEMLAMLFLFNTLALITWEWLAQKFLWLAASWAIRLVATLSGTNITMLAVYSIVDEENSWLFGLLWLVWLSAVYIVYRVKKTDLFMLAGGCLSGIFVVTAFVSQHILSQADDPGVFLLLFLLVIGMGAGSAIWLKKIHEATQL